MADQKLTERGSLTTSTDDSLIHVVVNNSSYKQTKSNFLKETTKKGGYYGTTQDLKNELDAGVFTGALTYQTLALLNAVSPVPAEGTPAKVVNDPNPINNGFYSIVSSAWVKDFDNNTILVTETIGLEVNVGSFDLEINGSIVNFPSTNVTLPASSTHYLCYDLVDYSLHYLKRNITDGVIWVARVDTGASDVNYIEQITPKLPVDKIGSFNEKLNNSLTSVNVAVICDSLGTTTGGGISFPEQLFNIANVGLGYNVPNVLNSSLFNYSSGGQTSHYGALWTAQAVKGNDGFVGNTGISYTNIAQADQFDVADFDPLLDSPIFTSDYDLAIIMYGANGGAENLAHLENVIKNINDKGIAVIVLTVHQRTDNVSFLYDEGYTLKSMTDYYGCALVDTWSFVREAIDEGVVVHDDVIHLNEGGKSLGYSRPIRSIINNLNLDKTNASNRVSRIIKGQSSNYLSKNFPNHYHYDCFPSTNTGSFVSSAVSDYLNPSLQFGNRAASVSIISLEVGEKIEFAHGYASSFDVVYDKTMVGDFTVKISGTASPTLTFSQSVYAGSSAGVFEGSVISDFTDITTDLTTSKNIEIECTSGTARIYGLLWHVYKAENISLSSIKQDGTFFYEPSSYGNPKALSTDTIGDVVSFDYYGSGCQVLMSRRTAAGIVDVYLNGKLYIADLDLYVASTFIKPVYISQSNGSYYDLPTTKNTVSIHLKGVNGSAITPVSTNRRMMVIQITEFNRE